MSESRSIGARNDSQEWLVRSEPVILLGRGGSGTRLLAQAALSAGVFLGNELNATHDSVEWVEALYDLAVEALTVGVDSGSARDFYWRERLRRRAAEVLAANRSKPAILWGWKLPETMLALPQVLRTFPGGRVVHIVRHPLTSSLRRTHMTSRLDNPVGRAVLPAAYRALNFDPNDIEHDEPYVHNAVTWAFQVRNVLDALRRTPPTKGCLQLRYEEVCADPTQAQKALAAFLGIAASQGPPPEIDHGRIGTDVRTDGRAERIWAICGGLAAELGYER
jgi:Sulfotransferase family